MQRIVIDTNVLVSALIQRSFPYLIVNDLFLSAKIELCLSESVLDEYISVFNRRKFSKYPSFQESAQNLIIDIESKSIRFYSKKSISLLTDKDDNKFLELAAASKANFLITGNTNDFTIKKYGRTKIVSPKEFWENYRSE
jgi:uncharacterized protein